MNEQNRQLAGRLIGPSYAASATRAEQARQKQLTTLLSSLAMPQEAWSDADVEWLLGVLAADDSNNYATQIGVGEREGRVASPLVRALHAGFAHGVGRSGDVHAMQPKAAGGSLLSALSRRLATHALRVAGLSFVAATSVLPVATGMTLWLCLTALRRRAVAERAKAATTTATLTTTTTPPWPRYVVWPRVDQKTCFKCIDAAGFEPIVVENVRGQGVPFTKAAKKQAKRTTARAAAADTAAADDDDVYDDSDELQTDIDAVRRAILGAPGGGARNVLCVLSTTSCFAPRAPERVVEVAQLCAELGVAHVVNNAYGAQCAATCAEIARAVAVGGRVDCVVQSLDKNFQVPVGGALAASADAALIDEIGQAYCGRASIVPARDLVVTLLGTGVGGFERALATRRRVFDHLRATLRAVARDFGERVLRTPNNHISLAMTLQTLAAAAANSDGDAAAAADEAVSAIGGMLYTASVTGHRVVTCRARKRIDAHEFVGWGAHADSCDAGPYLTVAAAMGMTEADVDAFAQRLRRCLSEFRKKQQRPKK